MSLPELSPLLDCLAELLARDLQREARGPVDNRESGPKNVQDRDSIEAGANQPPTPNCRPGGTSPMANRVQVSKRCSKTAPECSP